MIYFNDNEQFVCQWLRNLWPDAMVDERSINDVSPTDLAGFRRCHFFGGIGGWEYALQLAGWPQEWEVWTGSCPCQPFSVAGNQLGEADERHLWPEFRRLITECHPATIFGEQVASKLGREWLAGVFVDLEAMGYAVAGADLPAACVGAPHVRQRLWWVADSMCVGWTRQQWSESTDCCAGRLEHATSDRRLERRPESSWWSTAERRPCSDGKSRPIEPGIEPLAYGVPNRVGQLRAYGNAIVPQVAAEFIKVFIDTRTVAEG